MKSFLIKFLWILNAQIGLDPLKLVRFFGGLFHYARDFIHFKRTYNGRLTITPCLHDWYEEGGATKSEYFWQDLLVARWIFDAKPQRHVDVGSRVDGFVAHVASFREIEVFDVRPNTSQVPAMLFKQADLMKPTEMHLSDGSGYCDSLSCLHALEHFGLGRYGDPIDPQGYEEGIANMARLIKPGGVYYLSTPIGKERVEFNANRVFDPRTIIKCAASNRLHLQELFIIDTNEGVCQVQTDEVALLEVAQANYNLGIFIFKKME